MRTIILLIFYLLGLILLTPVLLVFWALGKKEPVLDIGKWAMGVSRWILGLKVEVEGLENVDPHRTYVFMANHVSFLDGPLLFYIIPQRVRVILKKSIFRIPVAGQAMRLSALCRLTEKASAGGKKALMRLFGP